MNQRTMQLTQKLGPRNISQIVPREVTKSVGGNISITLDKTIWAESAIVIPFLNANKYVFIFYTYIYIYIYVCMYVYL